jgi:hypothetical protein
MEQSLSKRVVRITEEDTCGSSYWLQQTSSALFLADDRTWWPRVSFPSVHTVQHDNFYALFLQSRSTVHALFWIQTCIRDMKLIFLTDTPKNRSSRGVYKWNYIPVQAPILSWAIKGKIFERVWSVPATRLLSPEQTLHKTKCKQLLVSWTRKTRASEHSYRTTISSFNIRLQQFFSSPFMHMNYDSSAFPS